MVSLHLLDWQRPELRFQGIAHLKSRIWREITKNLRLCKSISGYLTIFGARTQSLFHFSTQMRCKVSKNKEKQWGNIKPKWCTLVSIYVGSSFFPPFHQERPILFLQSLQSGNVISRQLVIRMSPAAFW